MTHIYILGYPHYNFNHVVKVGISDNARYRAATIQAYNPDQIELYHYFDISDRSWAYAIEQDFHKRFGDHLGIRGEWLAMSPRCAIFMVASTIHEFLVRYRLNDEMERLNLPKIFVTFGPNDSEREAWMLLWETGEWLEQAA